MIANSWKSTFRIRSHIIHVWLALFFLSVGYIYGSIHRTHIHSLWMSVLFSLSADYIDFPIRRTHMHCLWMSILASARVFHGVVSRCEFSVASAFGHTESIVRFVGYILMVVPFSHLQSYCLPCPVQPSPDQPDEAFLHGILFNFHIINFENPSFCICQCRRWSDNGFVRSYSAHSSQREESDNSTSGRRNHVCLQFLSTSLWSTSETEIFYMDDASTHLSIRWSVWPFVQPATRRWRYASTTGRTDGLDWLMTVIEFELIFICAYSHASLCAFFVVLVLSDDALQTDWILRRRQQFHGWRPIEWAGHQYGYADTLSYGTGK